MRIIGIDPGLRITGFGIIDFENNHLNYIASGVIKTNKTDLGNLPERLKILFNSLCELIDKFKPDIACIEIIFININPQSSLLLGQARGTALTALVHKEIKVIEYTALQMKKAIIGNGRATKSQIQEMVKENLNLSDLPSKDAADALGLAITHSQANKIMKNLDNKSNRRQHALIKKGRIY